MRTPRQMILTLIAIISLLLTPTQFVRAENEAIDETDVARPIRLTTGTFIPGQSPLPLNPELSIASYLPGQAGYYIVQFRGPVQQAWKNSVAATGATLLGYLPDYAFKVRMTPEQAAQVAAQSNVRWVGIFQPAYKLSLDLPSTPTALYSLILEQGVALDATVGKITATGAKVVQKARSVVVVLASPNQVTALARILDIGWIEKYSLNEKHNDSAAGIILGGNTANTNGYDGSSQIAAVADTGLGDGTAAGAHPDIPANRIVNVFNWPGQTDPECFQEIKDDGAQDVDSGHGTHVAGSVVGDGGDNSVGKAAAPAAKLVFQAVENYVTYTPACAAIFGMPAEYRFAGLPADLNDLFQQAYDAGARVHANSWGSSAEGQYNANSFEADTFIWQHPDMAITFAAGNEGVDVNQDGVVDNQSLGSPATAKNVISIGASENARADGFPCDTTLTYPSNNGSQAGKTCSQMNGKNILGDYSVYGFAAEPLKSDLRAGNQEQMAGFSSRGPTTDGRIKPDVVAPGTWILSGYSGMHQEGYGDSKNPTNDAFQDDGWGLPFNQSYKYMGGTSMANPIAAGAAVLVRDYYQKKHNLSASAAIVKATLINSAVDLLDENNDGADDNDFPIPNMHEGWGRVNVANATDNSGQFVDDTTGVKTGETASKNFTVQEGGNPFKISLVWSDYPAQSSAGRHLVNNLDLVVTAPSGKMYLGNVFASGWSETGGTADELNNVENVYIQEAEAGEWKVEIKGTNVPKGVEATNAQPFALVVDGGTAGNGGGQPAIVNIQPNQGNPGQALQVTITATNTHFVQDETLVDFGEGIDVLLETVNSPTQVTVEIEIPADAAAGVRDIEVTTGTELVRKEAGFTVNTNGATPAILSVQPDNGTPGDTLDVTINAVNTNFVSGRSEANFGAGVSISTVTVISASQVQVHLTVATNAEPGERTVTLTTGAEVVEMSNGFRVNVDSNTGGATLYVDPSPTSMALNSKATLKIMLSPGSTPINGVQIHGRVDPAYLRLVNVISGTSKLSEVLDPIKFDPNTGIFRFGSGVLGQTVAEPFVLLSLEVEAIQATGANGTAIDFLNTFPATDIAGPSGGVMEAARDGVVTIGGQGGATTLTGRIDLQGRPAKPSISWSTTVTVELMPKPSGTPNIQRVTTNQQGEFTLTNLTPGNYSIRVKGDHTLANRIEQFEVKQGSNTVFLGTLYEGDVEVNTTGNQTVIADFGQLSGAFGKCENEAGYLSNADLDESDNCVTITDYGLLSPNFNKQGDLIHANARSVPAPLPLAQPNAILAFEGSSLIAPVGTPIDLKLYVDPRGGDAVVGVTAHYGFDPALLEVLEVTLTDTMPRVLSKPVIDSSKGTIYFAIGAELGKTISQRVQIATIRVKLKSNGNGAKLSPKLGGARDSNIAGVNGSVMAGAETVQSTSIVTLFDLSAFPQRVFLPMVRRN